MSDNVSAVWNEIGPDEHFCQFYEDEDVLLDTLDGFIAPGLRSGDAAIVIATTPHLKGLESQLRNSGIDVSAAVEENRYAPLDAADILSRFMVNDWPDKDLFLKVATDVIRRVSKPNRRIRAFGEMVALLWANGNRPATIRLETLWNDLAKMEEFSLYCAYPRHGFRADGCQDSLIEICTAHSRIISADGAFKKRLG